MFSYFVNQRHILVVGGLRQARQPAHGLYVARQWFSEEAGGQFLSQGPLSSAIEVIRSKPDLRPCLGSLVAKCNMIGARRGFRMKEGTQSQMEATVRSVFHLIWLRVDMVVLIGNKANVSHSIIENHGRSRVLRGASAHLCRWE